MLYALTHLKVWAHLLETSKEAPLCMYIVRGCQMISRMEPCTFKVEWAQLRIWTEISSQSRRQRWMSYSSLWMLQESRQWEGCAPERTDSWVADKALQIFITVTRKHKYFHPPTQRSATGCFSTSIGQTTLSSGCPTPRIGSSLWFWGAASTKKNAVNTELGSLWNLNFQKHLTNTVLPLGRHSSQIYVEQCCHAQVLTITIYQLLV